MTPDIDITTEDMSLICGVALQHLSRSRKIINAVSEATGVTKGELLGPSRLRRISWARQFAMWKISKETNMNDTQVGRLFNKHHTTVLHARRAIEKRRQAANMKGKSCKS
ncbi:MAG: helix-turn-helix domain-containing protein [Sulfitobacter sp.]